MQQLIGLYRIQIYLRNIQVQFPPHIITTPERPDLVMYSDVAKVVVILELTSPAEENIEKWRKVKLLRMKDSQRTSAKEEFGKSLSSQ